VLVFLAMLIWLESYKLVGLRTVLAVLAAGAAIAVASYFLNGFAIAAIDLDFSTYSRFVGPLIEELLKAAVVVVLLRTNRIGFLVDAAILGFAVGAGFAVVENVWYQQLVRDAGIGTWIVRGFGTAIMHGGATAIFAVMALAMHERKPQAPVLVAFAPGYALAVALHAAFNQMFGSPKLSTLAVLIVLPSLMFFVFQRSERALADWLGRGFDADAQMLESIESGRFSDSPTGRYLLSLKKHFEGPVIADLLCYIRLYTELALRAKGMLMMRESGFDVRIDDETRAKFDEVRYLERSIGKTALLAIRPMLRMSHKELWQLYMLER
jgi:RsiW-degrading membrane proteinase PrsW (M82 family)